MAAVLSAGEEHNRFFAWSQEQGVVINGLAPARFAGRGLGIVAARDLKEGEVLVKVPPKCLITIDSKVVRDLQLPRDCSVHGRLAAYLTLRNNDREKEHAVWQATWPTVEDFEHIMPFFWVAKFQDYLAPPGKALLNNQKDKFQKDLEHLEDIIPPESIDLYRYFWVAVNTRCFYWDYPQTPDSRLPKKRSDLKGDDCMALCPFADYFNHSDEGCKVTSDRNGFKVTCHRNHKAGEEVYVSYGSHSNDFLLVEYGFTLDSNKWDYTTLDHVILSKASKAQKEVLEEDHFLGTYTVTAGNQYCHRTQCALRLLALPPSRAKRRYDCFISGGDEGEVDQPLVNVALKEFLEEYDKLCRKMVANMKRMKESYQKDVLLKRWIETRAHIEGALDKLEEQNEDS